MKSSPSIARNLLPFLRGRLPGQLVIQYSSLCNADCPQCGMRRSNKTERFTLKKERVKKIIDEAAQKGFKSLSFTGGEPLLFLEDIVELTSHANRAGIPFVRTGTNGYLFCSPRSRSFETRINTIAEKLATTEIYTFWISLDSADPETHESMRGLNGVVKGIEKALPIFHSHGIYPAVNLGINRATGGAADQPFLSAMNVEDFQAKFMESFVKFYQFAIDLGFTIANACYPMSSCPEDKAAQGFEPELYGAASRDDVITFSNNEKTLLFKALYETIPAFREKIRIFTPRCSLYGLIKKFKEQSPSLFACRGGTDFFFVNSEHGRIFPCGYLQKGTEDLPDLRQRIPEIDKCELCEWECFRDPSDLMGPFAELFRAPFNLVKKITGDPVFFQLLRQDLRYYKACDFFNGRRAPRL